ncbi:MAG: hypothetical protein IKE91_02340 [Clostridia bacterium]|nr:hypothetical protein [Clostridia bacterium]
MKRIVSKFVLKSRIDKYVKKLPIDERFKPIISDIVLRRAAQFNRTYGELRTDLEALTNNLERIRIVARSKMAMHNYALAIYSGEDKEILISEDTLNETPERIYQIIAHELFHVMLKNNHGIDRLDKQNHILGTRSNLFQELIAEKGSYRLTYPVENDYRGFNSNVSGYDDISFILDFIEATYGVNEQDVIKHSLNGRRELAKFLASSIGEEIYEAEEFLDEIEVGGTLLFSTLYDNSESRSPKNKSKEEIDEDIIAGIDSMFSICQSKIEDRLRDTEAYTIEELKALKEEIACCEYRLINVLRNRLRYFNSELNIDVENLWKKCLGDYAEDVITRLGDMEQLIEDNGIAKTVSRVDCVSAVRGYTFDDDEFSRRFLTARSSDRSFTILKSTIDSKKEPAIYTEGWRNKHIIKKVEQIIVSEKESSLVSRLIAPRLAYEAQSRERAIDIYKLDNGQKRAYEDELKKVQESQASDGKSKDEDTEEIDDSNEK